jgi:hypothetical protein
MRQQAIVLLTLGFAASVGSLSVPVIAGPSEYNDSFCQQVVGTLNIHWEAVGGPFAPCTGIEFTNGTLADAADGTVTMLGTSVSNGSCIGLDGYVLTVSMDGLTLSGTATVSGVPMTLTRSPGEDCFVGHWVQYQNDYRAHIAAAPFLAAVSVEEATWANIKKLYR